MTDDENYGGIESSTLSDPAVDGWSWVTGEPVAYTNWFTVGEPNDSGDYVTIGTGAKVGGWNDDYGRLAS